MELLLPQFQEAHEKQFNKQKLKVVADMDENVFRRILILVLLDLSSGYLPLKDISDNWRFRLGMRKRVRV